MSEWAQTVRLRVFHLPGKVDELHRQAFAGYPYKTAALVVAYVRHHHTNYDNLLLYLRQCRENGADETLQAQDILHERTNAYVEAALDKQYGERWRKTGRERPPVDGWLIETKDGWIRPGHG